MKTLNVVKNNRGANIMYDSDDVFQASLKYFNGDELAANVWMSKYALKDGDNFLEQTPDDMHHRLAKEFARIEKKFGGDHALSEEYIYGSFKNFKHIVPQGSPMYGIGNPRPISLSNCVVVDSPEDTMSSIVDKGKELANLYKRRCGVGINISTLRPDGASVNNSAGTSSGSWSFADFYSYITRMVGQSGRRGALMISMDVRHPDIEKFITMKHDKTKVTGANVSVMLSDEFMKAVMSDSDFELKYPIDSKTPIYSRTVKAKKLWQLIIKSATTTAEPGLLMWDNIIKYMPAESYADVGFKTICTNPCAEIPLSAYDSCRLISINLKHFVQNRFTDQASFDFGTFARICKDAMRLSDDLVELELEKLKQVKSICDDATEKQLWSKLIDAATRGRRTGLGTHGLADAIAGLNLAYDSDEGLKIIDKIYSTLKVSAYRESIMLAKERGSFKEFDWEKEKKNAYIKSLPKEIRDGIEEFGRRNISILTNAPTGSVSLVSQTSSGLEPVFKNCHIRKKKINHDDNGSRVDSVDDMGDKWQHFNVFHHNVKEWIELNSNDKGVSPPIPSFFTESDNIDWMRRIEIQGVIQKHIDHAISSTINLPRNTSTKVVGKLYLEGWKQGLKGVTIYVDGSRDGVLVNEDSDKFDYKDARKRPNDLECDIHHVNIKGARWAIFVGLMDGKPYEVFGGLADHIEIPDDYKKGRIVKAVEFKKAPSRYDLKINGFVIKNIIKQFDNATYQVHTRMISLGLRHGARPSFLVEQLLKDPDNDLSSFSKVLSRVLKKYIEDGTEVTTDKICPSCESEGLVYQEGCVTCLDCGFAKCG